jgi:hypothetical protein
MTGILTEDAVAKLPLGIWKITAVAVLGSFLSTLDATIVNVSLSSLAVGLHSTLTAIQWVTSGYLLALALMLPLNGWLVERIGAIRRDVLAKHPQLAKTVYEGFCGAKEAAVEQYKHGLIFNNMNTMFPWFSDLINEDRAVLGEDWWPYGIEANRKSIEAVLRYHFEQGITARRFTIDDVFVPELLAT